MAWRADKLGVWAPEREWRHPLRDARGNSNESEVTG